MLSICGEPEKTQADLTTLLLHKPYGVLSQFTPEPNSRWRCLADLVDVPDVYAAGRLDADSEGLLVLTPVPLQHRPTNFALVTGAAIGLRWKECPNRLICSGCAKASGSKDKSLVAKVAGCRDRRGSRSAQTTDPHRASIPTSWLELSLKEGRNRQVRRMTAVAGLPTLRLVRCQIDLMDGEQP